MNRYRISESTERYWDWDDEPYTPEYEVTTFRIQMRILGVVWLTIASYTHRDKALAMGKAVKLLNILRNSEIR